jgi:hypothetical protein
LRAPRIILTLIVAILGIAHAQTNTITVDIGSSRSIGGPNDPVAAAVRARATKIAALTVPAKRRLLKKHPNTIISFPTRVLLTRNGVPVATRSTRGPGQITITFNHTAGATFDIYPTYEQDLTNVFNATESEMTRLFGAPFQAGTILVSNYDATIGYQDAVAGGIYLPNNGSDQQEIRFPYYFISGQIDVDAMAIDFIHTLLLAYQGTSPYAYDAFEEGLARAVTATIAREPEIQTTLGLNASTLEGAEAVLASTYDVYGSYDWDNQRGLGAPRFIAANLIGPTDSPAGTNGGIYNLRYRMAGSAWLKVLTEYPTFIASLNTIVAANPSLTSNVPGLIAAAQTVLNADNPTNPTVENMPFAQWFAMQYILQTNNSAGTKVIAEVVPEPPDPTQTAVPDFGLFDVETNYFATDSSGNETYPNPNGGVAYPLYLDNAYNRFSPAAQDDVMPFELGYGSVTPNFLSSYTGGLMYRVAIDIPVNDQVTRIFVPAGGVSTSSNPTTNEFYGTVSGDDPPAGGSEDVKVLVGTDLVTDAPVVDGAFGVNILSQFDLEYSIARKIEAQVWVTDSLGNSTMVLDRFVDKPKTGSATSLDGTQVGLGLDLRVGSLSGYPLTISAGLNAIGFPIDPFSSDAPTVLNVDPSQLLVSRYDGITGQYLLNPSVEPFKIGHGYFIEVPSSSSVTVTGRSSATTPVSVALEPGWNLVGCALPATTQGTQVLVYDANDLSTPLDFTDTSSAGTLLGNTFFQFTPGGPDPAAGYPTTGSFTAATQFVPGQAYFVFCAASTGVVLEFVPSSLSSSVKKRAPVAPAVPVSWQVHVGVAGSAGDVADCIIGVAPGATSGFDRALDSGMPPSVGGLQLVSQTSQALYRDFRGPSSSVSYTLVASNLKVGKSYNMSFIAQVGAALRMTIRNQAGITVNVQRNGHFYFVPTASTQTFTVTAVGVAG